MRKNILLLTSKENFVWQSMQEIIPYLEHTWISLDVTKFKVDTINIDSIGISGILPKVLAADYIVSTCFNLKMYKILVFIRKELRLGTPMIHYVHNMATIGFWPYRFWGQESVFQKQDRFIVSCIRDIKTMHLMIPEAQVSLIPFGFIEQDNPPPRRPKGKFKNFIYIGRISPQKNLHGLLLAYSLLHKTKRNEIPNLIFYGKEDHLGSPNMNLKNRDYLAFLQRLTRSLGLENCVQFLGHRPRDEIRIKLQSERNLLVSPSLHSDENFGMVVLQALLLNVECVITDWGGFADFKKYFPKLVDLIPVQASDWGPSVLPQQIAEILEVKLDAEELEADLVEIPSYYSLEFAHKIINETLSESQETGDLKFSKVADALFERIQKLTDARSGYQMQIFEDFQDPLFHRISETYMTENPLPKANAAFNQLVPWIEETSREYRIADPQKGSFVLQKEIKLHERIKEKLIEAGYLF